MTDNDRAKSFERLIIWLPFIPGAGFSSKRVITGPGWTATTLTSTYFNAYHKEDGSTVSNKVVKSYLKDIIEQEDNSNPYNDEELAEKLAQNNFPVHISLLALLSPLLKFFFFQNKS